jgi:sulfoxide reductase heme-binding subunit YedZ
MTSYTDPNQHLFWLGSRALGIVAIALLAISVTLGLLFSGRYSRSPGVPAWLKHLHEAVALTALGAIAGHGLLLLGDSYLRPGISGIVLPFAIAVKPIWTGLGVIGGWLAALLGLSFYARRFIGLRTWRWLHRWTVAAYALAVAHALGSGTDAASPWFVVLVAIVTAPPLFLLILKFLPRPSAGQTVGTPGRTAPALAPPARISR